MKPCEDGEGVAMNKTSKDLTYPNMTQDEPERVKEIMSCDHPDRDISYSDMGDHYDESKIAHCSACGHEWFISQREWRELTGILP